MIYRLILLSAGALLLAPGPAYADLASEAAAAREAIPARIVGSPRVERAFGVPNLGEFPADPPAARGETRIVPYPHETRPFGVPDVSEFDARR